MRKFFTFFMMAMAVMSAISCNKDSELDPGVENPPVPSSYKVGDLYDDGTCKGVVFEISEDALSGKIVALNDAEKKLRWSEAQEWCNEVGTAWRLPSVDEAKTIYEALEQLNKTLSSTTGASPILIDWYWTSDKADNNEFVWTFSMETGKPAYYDMYSGYENTRVVRTIGDKGNNENGPEPVEFSIVGQWELVDNENASMNVTGVDFKEGIDIGYTNTDAMTYFLEVVKSSHSSYKEGTRYDQATCHDANAEETERSIPYSLVYENGVITALELKVDGGVQTYPVEIVDENNITFFGMPLRRLEPQPLSPLDLILMDSDVKALCVENWDTNKDGWIDIDEAAAVTDLETVFFDSKIRDFSELKYFTGLTTISASAFMYSTVNEIIIPENVTRIKREAFKYCEQLNNITIPAGVTAIESTAFFGCESMVALTCLPTIPPTLGSDALFTISDDPFKILVPNESYELYISARDWKTYKDRINNADNRHIIIFADSKVKDICVAHWDTDKDGEFSYDEAAAVNLLGNAFSSTEIKEFTELQHFTGLATIGSAAFKNCNSLTKVVIPDNVTSIDEYAFNNCDALESITIHKNIKSIGNYAFYECSSLSDVQFRTGAASIGKYAFARCSALSGISIPDSVTSIGEFAFMNCASLKSLSISDQVTVIKEGTFCECASLKYLTIPEGVATIEKQAFWGCGLLTYVTLPTNLKSIGEYVFCKCSSLTSITIPENVTRMGDFVFTMCTSLSEVICEPSYPPTAGREMFYDNADNRKIYVYDTFLSNYKMADNWSKYADSIVGYSSLNKDPNAITFADSQVRDICLRNWDTNKNGHLSKSEAAAVKTLGSLFDFNSSITSFDELQYFTGLTTIDDLAFLQCTSLTSVTLPSSLTSIGMQAFQGCSSLKSIVIPESVTSIGEAAFLKCTNLKTINIPNKVTTLEHGLFDYCYSLQNITIPSGVTTIADRVFANCESLETITIPNGVTVIGDSAFANCNTLKSIEIPNNVKTLGAYVGFNCANLEKVTIGTGVTSLDLAAFFRCRKLKEVYCKSTTPPAGSHNIFSENATGRKIYVPTASVSAYKSAAYWSDYVGAIVGYNF